MAPELIEMAPEQDWVPDTFVAVDLMRPRQQLVGSVIDCEDGILRLRPAGTKAMTYWIETKDIVKRWWAPMGYRATIEERREP